MRIALAQINTSMGAIEANVRRIEKFLDTAKQNKADLTVFPELALIGYPPKDLLEYRDFLEQADRALHDLARRRRESQFILGTVTRNNFKAGKGRSNSAVYVADGKVSFVQPKRLLPAYDVFDEHRYFDPGIESQVLQIRDQRIGLTICEDIWTGMEPLDQELYSYQPLRDLLSQGVDWIINISASPYHVGKEVLRRKLVEKLVQEFRKPVFYCNLVGGNDELLFDGGSFAINEEGNLLGRAKVFEEDLLVLEIGKEQQSHALWPTSAGEWTALALQMGLRDYVHKCGFQKVLLGISGGIDSALVALLSVAALGPKNVLGVSMPSRFTSQETREDAETLARNLGIEFVTLPIQNIVNSFEETLAPAFEGHERDVTEENIQARIRGALLMALSNKLGHLVVSTGNKTEMAVGYCTQYGDVVGGLAVISDLSKQEVYQTAEYLNSTWNVIPRRIFERAPTAELRPNQTDEQSIPPYRILDAVVQLHVEERASLEDIVAKGFDRTTVEKIISMIDRSEFKRRQAPPGLKVSAKAFGVGRRMPIARGPA